MARLLLQRAADTGTTKLVDANGSTALHGAALKGHSAMTTFLLKCGASVAAVGQQHRTALHLAAQENHVEVAQESRRRCLVALNFRRPVR